MKIQIGSVITSHCGINGGNICLNIPGIGVLKSMKDEKDKPFDCIVLDKKQLKKLRKEIDKELSQCENE